MLSRRAAFLFALLFSASVLAQGVQIYDAQKPSEEPTTETDTSAVKDPEAEFDELEKELAAQNKKLGAVATILESPEEKRDRLDAEEAAKDKGPAIQLNTELMDLQKELQNGKTSMDVLKDPVLRQKLIAAYEKNPMVGMPRELLKGMIGTQVQKTPLGPLVKTFPKVLDFLVDLMRHPRALAQAVKVLNRMDDLKKCGYVSIGLMIFVFILRKKLIKKRSKFMKRLLVSISTSAIMLGGSIGFLWMTFKEELGPSWDVFRQTFL